MNPTTLRGIFPEPKPVHRKNFMKENIRMLKQMQQQQSQISEQQQQNVPKNKAPRKVYSSVLNISSRYKNTSKNLPSTAASSTNNKTKKSTLDERSGEPKTSKSLDTPKNFDKGVQTERNVSPKSPEYDRRISTIKRPPFRSGGRGDVKIEDLSPKASKPVPAEFQNLQTLNKEATTNTQSPRKTYHRFGRKDKGEEAKDDPNANLVLLPDEERKEYLRVARENYAGLIKELNSMPVKNDTLKRRNRKVEIEIELRRLDEVIKIFQKPKVFVKADS